MKVGDKLTNTGTVKVAKGQDLRFNVSNTETNKLGGTIEVAVDAFLTVEKDINLYSKATIKNSGVVSSIAGEGGIYNSGTISVLDDGAITYIQDNTGGTINLKNRDDEVKVQAAKGTIIYNYNFAEDKKNFTYTVADKFTKVIFKADTEELYLPAYDVISAIDMEFQGTTEIFTNGQTIRDLVVASGAHLKLTTPTKDYNKKLNVTNVTNKGNITIGGYIIYETNYTNDGTVRSVGGGAITKKPATPSTGDTSTSTGDKTAE